MKNVVETLKTDPWAQHLNAGSALVGNTDRVPALLH
jgi:hypothetical protein